MSVILFKNFGKKRQRLLSLAHSFFFFQNSTRQVVKLFHGLRYFADIAARRTEGHFLFSTLLFS